jgi:hypothetical protein
MGNQSMLRLFLIVQVVTACWAISADLKAAPIDKKLVVAGSSVPRGYGSYTGGQWEDNFNGGDPDYFAVYGYANRLRLLLTEPIDPTQPPLGPGDGVSTTDWSFRNVSIGGNDTADLQARFAADVVSENPEYLLIGLSLGNEGLPYGSNPQASFDSFRDGMLNLIQEAQTEGIAPVIGLVYPHADYNLFKYGYVKEMNLLMNTWGVPCINLLGAIDNGRGQWADGFVFDNAHPNIPGHEEMFYAIVPSLFEAMEAGKTTVPSYPSDSGFARLARDASQPSPITFTPSHTMHAFTTSFKVRSNSTGTVAAVRSTTKQLLLVDFGPSDDANGRATSSPDAHGRYWTSWRPVAGGSNVIPTSQILSPLTDALDGTTNGRTQGMTLEVTDAYSGANGIQNGGLLAPETERLGQLAIATATEDYFFVGTGEAAFKITGLDTNKAYTLRLFGSRAWDSGFSDPLRKTRYTVRGGLPYDPFGDLVTSEEGLSYDGMENGNDDGVALLAGVTPDGSGEIEVEIATQEGTLAYLNLMEVLEHGATDRYGTIELRDNEIAYVSPDGEEITYSIDADDGSWHEIALSHRFAQQETLLYVNGVLAGSLRETLHPDLFVLGGSGSSGSDAPLSADYQDWCINRAAWTPEEALAQHQGALQHASLEVLAPLSDASFSLGGSVANEAQSLAAAVVNTSNVAPGLPVAPPGDLTGTSYATTSVELSWTDNSSTESGVVIERRQSHTGQAWATLATLDPDTTAYTDSGLIEGVSYDYRVSTLEGASRSATSNSLSIAAGSDGQSYREWADNYFNLPATIYRIDFNTIGGGDYGGEIWNRIGSLSDPTPYTLTDANGDSSANYTLTVTGAFDQFRSANGNPLANYPVDAQRTSFIADRQPQPTGSQLVLSGLNRNAYYDITLLARRGSTTTGFDYRGRYTFSGGGAPVSFELDTALNEQLASAFLPPDSAGNIIIDISAADDPAGDSFPGINFMVVREMQPLPPAGSFLIDLNDGSPSYPAGQTWNTLTSPGDTTSYPLADINGSTAAGYTYQVTSAFSETRSGSSLPNGFAGDAESSLFLANASGGSTLTFSGLDPAIEYDVIFLAYRGTVFGGFDYSGTYTITGASTTALVADGAIGSFTIVDDVSPSAGGTIALTVAAGPGDGTDFPILNLVILAPQTSGSTDYQPGDDSENDGNTNLIEYARGLNPTLHDRMLILNSGTENNGADFFFAYTRSRAAQDIVRTILSSPDLNQAMEEDGQAVESPVSTHGDMETIKISRPMSSDPKRFFEIDVQLAP